MEFWETAPTIYAIPKFKRSSMRILLFLLDAIGDFIVSTPFMENIRKKYDNAFIGVVCSRRNMTLVEKSRYINIVHVFDRNNLRILIPTIHNIRKMNYDILVDTFYTRFSTAHKILTLLSGVKTKIAVEKQSQFRKLRYKCYFDEVIPLSPGYQSERYNNLLARLEAPPVTHKQRYTYELKEDVLRAARQIMPTGVKNIVLVCQGSRWDNTLPPETVCLIVQKLLSSKPEARIYLSSAPGRDNPASRLAAELASPRVIALPDLSGDLDFTAAVVAQAHLLISTGTATLHMGGAFNVPTVGIYPPQEHAYLPITSQQKIVRSQSAHGDSFPVDAEEITLAALNLLDATNQACPPLSLERK